MPQSPAVSVPLGLLFSTEGDYALLSDEARRGALAAVEHVNGNAERRVSFEVHKADPHGRTDRYAPLCADLLRGGEIRHVVGCITSWSRKEVAPVLERHGAMLWYAPPYEGYEAHDRIVYLGACPNQHIVPLLGYVVPRFGADAFLVGSNYIWGWEVNRIARDLVGDAGGCVVGERYLPLGDVEVSRMIEEIRATRPSFVLNNLIGPSSYAFLKAYAALAAEDEAFRADIRPVISCNLVEPEIAELDGAGEGHIAVGPFFAGMARSPLPEAAVTSSFMASAYSAVLILADAIEAAGDDAPEAVCRAFASRSFLTPLGDIAVDPHNHHADLPVRIGVLRGDRFEPLWQSPFLVAPDPYLSHYDPRTAFVRPALRAIS